MSEKPARPIVDLTDVEQRWTARWREERAHERDATPGTPKFFATYPYSYMNAFAHVGHAFTMMRSDLFVRYHRMRGRNVLFPFAFHVTGTPIVAAANRVRDGDAQQIKILKDQGIPDDQLEAFKDPVHWVRYFPPKWREDVERLGLHVDWRREFITTELNPHYDAFVKWQFGKLGETGRVAKGRHPVIWCPKDQAVVADHDRYSGEGETPQEWTLYKMPLLSGAPAGLSGKVVLIAATLRPDTVFGQTNVWIDPAHAYRVLKVGDERWIVNETSAKTLPFQLDGAKEMDGFHVPGKALLGHHAQAPGTLARVPILPATFIRHEKGTGIVTSVPSDSPQDLLSLRAVQEGRSDEAHLAEVARAIRPIPVIRTERYGVESAAKAVEETGARDDRDAERIAAATEKAYQAGFYEGVMLENAGEFAGVPVAQAKARIQEWLAGRGEAVVGWWPSGPVVCRCLTPSVVKIVSDQWFVRYGEEEWKAETRAAMARMEFYPPAVRKQFENVVEWLRDWACTREHGLGTRLPQDPRWLIESLSDSTIYMAYYTFAHLLERGAVTGAPRKGVDPNDLTPAFFDHVLLDAGKAEDAVKGTVTREVVEAAAREFRYWYPLDFRNSGKDLVQNHLTFMVFNHTAVWEDPRWWPRSVGVNGWVMVDGEKMSKSRGNFITLRQSLDAYGASATRFALASAGEGVDDANFDRDVAAQAQRRLRAWVDLATGEHDARQGDPTTVDRWMLATLDRLAEETRENMEQTMFRSALKTGYHDVQREWSWYVRRAGGRPHAQALERFLRVQNAILTPFVPAVAEEVHARRGWPGRAIDAPWPAPEAKPDPALDASEQYVRNLLDDVRNILKVTKITPKRIVLTTAPAWKRAFDAVALQMAREKRLQVGDLIKAALADPDVKAKGAKDAPKLAGDAVKSLANLGPDDLATRALPLDETAILRESVPFLSAEFGCDVVVQNADDATLVDPAGKAKFANVRKPAIFVE
ncbi:MAG TPA: leucine--tRNA ligase [Candidatus Thermoplasmatota archaeon]|nr:leucine--tRNA ligase [Candidatus Thermoplasmatota archaeon]